MPGPQGQSGKGRPMSGFQFDSSLKLYFQNKSSFFPAAFSPSSGGTLAGGEASAGLTA